MQTRKRYRDDILADGQTLRVPIFAMDGMQRSVARHVSRIVDAAGNSGQSLQRPGFRILLGDEAARQRVADAHAAHQHYLENAWRGGKEDVVPDAPKTSGNDAMPVDDVETAYRLYAEEISQAWKTPR